MVGAESTLKSASGCKFRPESVGVCGRFCEAGVMEHIGMYPLDTVKTHMQAQGCEGAGRGMVKP